MPIACGTTTPEVREADVVPGGLRERGRLRKAAERPARPLALSAGVAYCFLRRDADIE